MKDAKKDYNPAGVFVALMRHPEHTWRKGMDGEIKFIFKGNLDETKIARAIELSVTKYCSVAKTLEPTAKITSSFEIVK